MKYSLLKNGTDSLKVVFKNSENYYLSRFQKDYLLKDSIIFLNHGIEILFKYILREKNPAFMFSNLEKYMFAAEKMKKLNASNIFEIDPNLKTVTLMEALRRIEYLCYIHVPEDLKGITTYFNKFRNQIMHYGIDLNEDEVRELDKQLSFGALVAIEFFMEHISGVDFLVEFSREEIIESKYLTVKDIEDLKKEFKALAKNDEVYGEALGKLNGIEPINIDENTL